jgi:hypothetical protein
MNEAELKEWVNKRASHFGENAYLAVRTVLLEELFHGKKLVDDGAVVLSRATADWMLKNLQEGFTSYAREHLGETIEQARGKNAEG